MSRKAKKLFIGIFVVFFSYFWWRGSMYVDPDFGWHIQMGWLIAKQGIPLTDPFSYTMSSYPVVGHEWLTDVFLSQGMDTIGYVSLAGIFAFLAVAAYSLPIVTLSAKAKQFALPFLFLALFVVSGFVGVRPQILTWFFLSLILTVIRDRILFEKYRFFLPVLFLLWANLHGGFAVGIIALLVATVYWWYKNPTQWLSILGVFAASVTATFVMPYGYRSWWEVWMTTSDASLRWKIMEWTPTIFVPNIQLWFFIVFSGMFVGRYFRKFSLLDLLLYGGLLAAGISSIRHAPLWLLIALPMTIQAVVFFYQEITKIKYAVKRFAIMTKLFFALICLLVLFELPSIVPVFGSVNKQDTYPEKAIGYIKSNLPDGQVFSTYNWGGYLIWKLPEKKVYIDGRMPSWRWNANLPKESNYAFEDFGKFIDGTIPFDQHIQKYGIDTLLLPAPREVKKNPVENMLFDFMKNVLRLPLKEDVGYTKLVTSAKKAGWKIVYEDKTAVVYRKK